MYNNFKDAQVELIDEATDLCRSGTYEHFRKEIHTCLYGHSGGNPTSKACRSCPFAFDKKVSQNGETFFDWHGIKFDVDCKGIMSFCKDMMGLCEKLLCDILLDGNANITSKARLLANECRRLRGVDNKYNGAHKLLLDIFESEANIQSFADMDDDERASFLKKLGEDKVIDSAAKQINRIAQGNKQVNVNIAGRGAGKSAAVAKYVAGVTGISPSFGPVVDNLQDVFDAIANGQSSVAMKVDAGPVEDDDDE